MTNLLRNFIFISSIGISGLSNAAASDAEVSYPAELVEAGRVRFAADCGFCHGRDAAGGAQGLDLIRSELVTEDVDGELISAVVRNGRIDTPMPAFPNMTNADLSSITAFIHNQQVLAESAEGGRRAVEPADLATGNAEQGQLYFQSACASCHAPNGDLAGIASRLQGLPLLRRMLYPGRAAAPARLSVMTNDGQSISGTQVYRDEFTIALTDSAGVYHSWSTQGLTFTVDDPLLAHIEQLALYTDEDMHNVLAYLQTLR